MRCLGDFVISLDVFKLYEKHFIINHCLTLELITVGCWAVFKNSFKKDISLECCVCVCVRVGVVDIGVVGIVSVWIVSN